MIELCAELPGPILQPRLHAIVKRCMMHDACGVANKSAPCLKDGKCSKRIPKTFSAVNTTSEDGYPLYRRGNDDRAVNVGGHAWIIEGLHPTINFYC